jgi:hypothetical protein
VESPAFGFCLLEEGENTEETKDVTDMFSQSYSFPPFEMLYDTFSGSSTEEVETYRGRGCSFSLRLRSPSLLLGSISGTDMAKNKSTWLW